MSNIGNKVSTMRRSALKRETSEKENEPPSKQSHIRKLSSVSCVENPNRADNLPKRRLSLTHGELKREDSRIALEILQSNGKKTPFRIHCDEEKAPVTHEEKETGSKGVTKPAKRQRSNLEHGSKIPVRKASDLVRSQSASVIGQKAQPTRIILTGSVDATRNKGAVPKTSAQRVKTTNATTAPRKIIKVPSKVEAKKVEVAQATLKSTLPKRTLSSLRIRTGRETIIKKQVSIKLETQKCKSNSEDVKQKLPTLFGSGKSCESTVSFPREVQDSGVAEMSTSSDNPENRNRKDSIQGKQIIPDNVITPIDGPPPAPLMPVKALIRQAKVTAFKAAKKLKKQETVVSDPFPVELVYHMEYQDDLLSIEKEREERAPRLSSDFLHRHINAHQRKEIVAYLIHLGVHCRYPSFIIYQTVKLFDAVMDKLAVHTTRLQLTALAALWVSLKRLEVFQKVPSATTILALAKEMYEGRMDLLLSYERKVLQAVDFNISFADAFSLLSHYIIICKRQTDIPEERTALIYNYGGYMMDLTMLDAQFCRLPASLVALIVVELAMVLVHDSISNVMDLIQRRRYWRAILTAGTDLCDTIQETKVNSLKANIIQSIKDSGNKRSGYEIVYKKYNRSRYGYISESLVERAKRLPCFGDIRTAEFLSRQKFLTR